MSASIAQVNANRANAQHSTGPRTEQGAAACKLNALKFGLTASEVVIPGEDPAAYTALRDGLIQTYAPASELEAMMVERASICWWKMLRSERVERILSQELPPEKRYLDDVAARKWNNFMRHKNSIEKSWRFALAELKHYVAIRQKNAAAQVQAAALRSVMASHIAEGSQRRESDSAKIGSVLQIPKKDAGAAPSAAPETAPSHES